jgi:hypothetical protein
MRTNYEIALLVKCINLSEKHKAKFIVTIRRKKHVRTDKADIRDYGRVNTSRHLFAKLV